VRADLRANTPKVAFLKFAWLKYFSAGARGWGPFCDRIVDGEH
jgi:hypothetical protein